MPVEFVHRICEDVRSNPHKRRTKFVNRLTPMTVMGRATEKGLEEVGEAVLREHFHLAGGSEPNIQPFSVSNMS
jgi:tRNA acetyltransferase TAN1